MRIADITRQREALDSLNQANQQIANLLGGISDACFSLNQSWQFTYMNRQAGELFHQEPAQLLGQTIWETLPELQGSEIEHQLRQASADRVSINFEHYWPIFQRWLEIRISPVAGGLLVFLLDVSDRHMAQVELLEMSSALGNAVEGIARLDLQGRYIALNRSYAEVLGYEPEEMIGMAWEQTLLAEDIAEVKAAYHRVVTTGSKISIEARALRKDGSTFYKEVVLVPAYDLHDNLIGHHCFTRDITERKKAEESLRLQAEREQMLSAVAQRIRNSLELSEILNTAVAEVRQLLKVDRTVILQVAAENHIMVAAESVIPPFFSVLNSCLENRRFQQLSLTHHQDLVIDDVLGLLSDAREPPRSELAEIAALMQAWQVQALLSVPILLGDRLWGFLFCHQCTAPRQWEAFEIGLVDQLATHLVIAIQQANLYQQVQQLNSELEQQVQERTAQLQTALLYEALLKRITDSVRDSLNEEEILQRAVHELTNGLIVNGCDAALYNIEQRTSTICYEALRDLPSAKGVTLSMQDFPELYDQILSEHHFQFCQLLPDPVRSIERHYAVLVCPLVGDLDVIGDLWLFKPEYDHFSSLEIRLVQQVANQCAIAIRQARLYQAAQAQVQELEKLNQLKDDFLSTVSHELRTPMSNMKMAIHMLRNVETPERRDRYLGILQAECVREIELINDLLDLQRLEADSYRIVPEPLDVYTFIERLIEPFYERTRDREQNLHYDLPANIPAILSDRPTLERVLAELLNNACKYTPPKGEIVLRVELDNPDSARQSLLFHISNQAEIPAEELPRIFEKFYRVPAIDRWQQGGTGLGLALVQHLVAQLSGTIHVASTSQWTTFTVRLPLVIHPA
ncbi:MAG TPA: PAS domain-containing protein [Leptolyngbyaceae cyanobacterium M33_DOE_097]|uniref:histidine kinase n=1 Tax=Oscillatoriales cyanobacterium SpSt-418 TaxID=2282169 RepID=A0A7C3KHS6_9CYAN|nr:PAS domain-containing protein [Leptolyngbyaceae cyanobacterium M33_DOE_097]